MLSLDAFLMRIWPSRGDLVVVQLIDDASGRADKAMLINYPFSNISRAQVAAQIHTLEQQRANIYIALAGYAPGSIKKRSGRTGENAEWLRSLWLDIDCGLDKAAKGQGYSTKRDAGHALELFVNSVGLPAPLVVDSGGGLHVYWPLDHDVDQPTWRAMAVGLKQLCLLHRLLIDAKCTSDAARILRPTHTSNWKTGTARMVRVVADAPAASVSTLQSVLLACVNTPQTVAAAINGSNSYGLGTLDQADPSQFDGQKILDKCQQMQWALANPDDVAEPMWRQMVGMLYKTNKPELIHTISQGYAGYDHDETETKARNWKGTGALCSTLEELHPGGCNGCSYRGTIKSPSAIGFISAPPPVIKIDPATHMPEGWFQKDDALWLSTEEGPVKLYRGAIEVGIPYMERSASLSRMIAPVSTTMNGAVTQGYVDYATVNSPGELFKSLTTCGVVAEPRHQKVFLSGMRSWLQEARAQAALAPSRTQLGWTSTAVYDHDASYVLGTTTYHPDGSSSPARLVEQAAAIGRAMHAYGSLENWQRAFNLLSLPGYEAHMVMSWVAFAAPLIRMDEVAPALVHAYSQMTSQGKTTVLNYINSVYGNPHNSNLFWTGNTTPITMQTGLTLLNGVAMGVDEITLLGFEAARKTLYECTQQTGRKRSKQDGTMQESSMTKTMLYSTGNMSLQHVASTMQIDDTPLQMRLVEFPFRLPPMTQEERAERRVLTDSVKHNFGHAAPIYVSYVVKHQAKVAQRLATVRKQLESAIHFEDKERFQITSMAAMITGAAIAKHLKLIDHPVEHGVQWVVDWFGRQRGERKKAAETPEAIFERMASDLQLHILVVSTDNPTNPSMGGFVDLITKRPLKEVFGRHAQLEQRLYLDKTQVRNWLIKRGLDAKGMVDAWHRRGLLLSIDAKQIRLAAHTGYDMPQRNYCYVFDLSQLDIAGNAAPPP